MVLSLPLDEASAKVRTGGPVDDAEDYALDVWAGVVPLSLTAGRADTGLGWRRAVPDHVRTLHCAPMRRLLPSPRCSLAAIAGCGSEPPTARPRRTPRHFPPAVEPSSPQRRAPSAAT